MIGDPRSAIERRSAIGEQRSTERPERRIESLRQHIIPGLQPVPRVRRPGLTRSCARAKPGPARASTTGFSPGPARVRNQVLRVRRLPGFYPALRVRGPGL